MTKAMCESKVPIDRTAFLTYDYYGLLLLQTFTVEPTLIVACIECELNHWSIPCLRGFARITHP